MIENSRESQALTIFELIRDLKESGEEINYPSNYDPESLVCLEPYLDEAKEILSSFCKSKGNYYIYDGRYRVNRRLADWWDDNKIPDRMPTKKEQHLYIGIDAGNIRYFFNQFIKYIKENDGNITVFATDIDRKIWPHEYFAVNIGYSSYKIHVRRERVPSGEEVSYLLELRSEPWYVNSDWYIEKYFKLDDNGSGNNR